MRTTALLSILALALFAALSAPALADMPQFDTSKYCQGVSQVVGGSYAIEASCVDMENEARAKIEGGEVEPKIMAYCANVASVSGGSYSILQSCIEMENEAKGALGK